MKYDWKQLLSYLKKYDWEIVWIQQFHDFLDAGIEWIEQNRNTMKESDGIWNVIWNYLKSNHKNYPEVVLQHDLGYDLNNLCSLLLLYFKHGEQKFLRYMPNRFVDEYVEKIKLIDIEIIGIDVEITFGKDHLYKFKMPLDTVKGLIFNDGPIEIKWDFTQDCYSFSEKDQ